MLVTQLILKKREGGHLSESEIEQLVSGYTKGEIPDYQFSAFLMAAFLKGLDSKEIYYLTEAMLSSGKSVDLSRIAGPKIDKHSTGGVGDKVSLILAPLVAACGVTVPMIAGRGLGHTGGTLDKLESIPGYKTDLSLAKFTSVLEKIGLGIIGQTEEIAPADKKIYALRDVTATVDYIPFITASILSKKLAQGADGIVFDVKVGNGAFMKELSQARRLAQSLISIGRKFNKKSIAILTDMSEPLGEAVGNSLEVVEALEALKGKWKEDLKQVTYFLAAEMLIMAGRCKNHKESFGLLKKAKVVEDYSRLPQVTCRLEVISKRDGYVKEIQTEQIGFLAIKLGAGRMKKEDQIDHSAGFLIKKKIGEAVKKSELLVELYTNDSSKGEEVASELVECFGITKLPVKPRRKILYRITADSISKAKDLNLPKA
uniref:thymidine phosphorylase n=1 Tax=uncultured candidate division Zixibacteria bacterium Rifle_16ft_4_minimus_38126 TaxID=1665171 RepID=A0A0H4TRZ3_UNCZI|nr:pyrimidine-nucleoside phosphorylase [uncultured candidate division Zixibacteria bacterium Rifle_16ft_4_minimus_38126]